MEWISNPDAWIGLLTLIVLEIVLGVDNVVFISILAGKLPEAQQAQSTASRPGAGTHHAHPYVTCDFLDYRPDRAAFLGAGARPSPGAT